MITPAVTAEALGRDHGTVCALDGIDLRLEAGRVLAVLGHNGAGKSTLLELLTSRRRPSRGRAAICGFDTVHEAAQVRRLVGVVGQQVSLDPRLDGVENLVLVARLRGAGREARGAANTMIERFDLIASARRPIATWSGGMRRRLDLAVGILGAPRVLFLDEPTTGLDPLARAALWDAVTGLVLDGTTVVLTTQYLEEADRLADEVLVLRAGVARAHGSRQQLVAASTGRTLVLTVDGPSSVARLHAALRAHDLAAVARPESGTVSVELDRAQDITVAVRALETVGCTLLGLELNEPGLDEVYRHLHRDDRHHEELSPP